MSLPFNRHDYLSFSRGYNEMNPWRTRPKLTLCSSTFLQFLYRKVQITARILISMGALKFEPGLSERTEKKRDFRTNQTFHELIHYLQLQNLPNPRRNKKKIITVPICTFEAEVVQQIIKQ